MFMYNFGNMYASGITLQKERFKNLYIFTSIQGQFHFVSVPFCDAFKFKFSMLT
jgi:hypothetical protein